MPETTAYLWLGLAVTFGLLLLQIGSMLLRHRNLTRDVEMLRQLQDDK